MSKSRSVFISFQWSGSVETEDQPGEFIRAMLAFTEWSLRTLGPKFVERMQQETGDATIEAVAAKLVRSILDNVRGNRGDNEPIDAATFAAVMDQLAALHLR